MRTLVLGLLLAIDPAKSHASFSVTHVFVERVAGAVRILQGTIEHPTDSLVPTRVTAVLDAASLATDDADRDASLRSDAWFDTARYPRWTFRSTSIAATANGCTIDGTIEIHGVERPVRLLAHAEGDASHPRYHATATIDRTQFGMKRTPLDGAIGTSVEITLDVVTQ